MPFQTCYKSPARGIGYPPEENELGLVGPVQQVTPPAATRPASPQGATNPTHTQYPPAQRSRRTGQHRPPKGRRLATLGKTCYHHSMAKPPLKLSPRHRQAIRAIVSGLPFHDAAAWVGLSPQRMSTVYRSAAGQAFALHLEALANDYVARMLALGITPQHIASAVGGGKHVEQCKPPSRRVRARLAKEAQERDAGRERQE